MEDLKKVIANNLIKYRKHAKLTQLELAEKLMYSDKNISKWERGDAVPDVLVLKQLADMYGISVNDFLSQGDKIAEREEAEKIAKIEKHKMLNRKQALITLISYTLVWLVAVVVFGVLEIFNITDKAWWSFIFALPVGSIVVLVFTSLWCTNLLNSIIVTFLIWTTALAFYLCVPSPNIWLIFIIAIPLQLLDILWFTFRKVNRNIKKDKQKKAQPTEPEQNESTNKETSTAKLTSEEGK